MLQAAKLAANVLADSQELAARFFFSQRTSGGGFRDREGKPDLYYSVFGVEGLCALGCDFSQNHVEVYLKQFENGENLDFVHLSSLVRCWADLKGDAGQQLDGKKIMTHLERYRTPDGGFNPTLNAKQGSAYGCFLALGIYEDMGMEINGREKLIHSIQSLRSNDGGYANLPGMEYGLTTAAAAAVCLLDSLESPIPEGIGDWLLGCCHPQGGFFAALMAPIPDLLSTATALHALERMRISLAPIQEKTLDFLDSLWCNQGGFYGNWADDILDCEYTFYGLLSLGHLSH
ncbi:MAG: hypothetical protein C4527_01965 [Candidatus Omnitrophota bacterium]|jgi:prenyltransferase beta subunit|nr:MAG: hypothetical protein C4527_01965 [Candidatus Omnitrophota bacterium]